MQRMHLVFVLRLLARENGVERDLITLVHDGPVAGDHFADVKMPEAGNRLQKFVRAGDDFIGGMGIGRAVQKMTTWLKCVAAGDEWFMEEWQCCAGDIQQRNRPPVNPNRVKM